MSKKKRLRMWLANAAQKDARFRPSHCDISTKWSHKKSFIYRVFVQPHLKTSISHNGEYLRPTAGKHFHWGEILRVSVVHGREKLGLKKSCGCKKSFSAASGRNNVAFF